MQANGSEDMHLAPAVPEGVSPEERTFLLIVNARPRPAEGREQDFLEIVRLAFPGATLGDSVTYTVTYKNGPHQNPFGSMVEGDTIFIKNGMRFHVTKTDKS
jgi:hypothetical protein